MDTSQMAREEVGVSKITIEPNNCPLESPIRMAISFTCPTEISEARWVVRFIADQVDKRKIIELGCTPTVNYSAGPQQMDFSVDQVDVAHLKRHVLANVGLLLAVLYSGEEERLQISMVTQVTPGPDGNLVRSVFNPLE